MDLLSHSNSNLVSRSTRAWVLTGLLAGLLGSGMLVASPSASSAARAASAKPKRWRILSVSAAGLSEVSGCAFSPVNPEIVWVHNDADDGPFVTSVNIQTGAVGEPVELAGTDVTDPEDIAVTPKGDLILADIGDNRSRRRSIALYRFREPLADIRKVEATAMTLTYPDGAHNAEAFAVTKDGATGLIITKESEGLPQVFSVKLDGPDSQELTLLGQINVDSEILVQPNQVTAADIVGNSLYLRTYQFGYTVKLKAPLAKTFAPKPALAKRFVVPVMPQGEALCVSPDGKTMVTASESRGAATFLLAVGPTPKLT